MKTSVVTDEFRQRYLEHPDHPGMFEGRAIVFEGPEDYHDRIDDPSLDIDEDCFLFIRNCGPVGYPGAAEVVNMRPPTKLIEKGIKALPTIGDGRQSGTSESPSILNASPEAAIGGNLAIVRTGDTVRLDLPNRRLDLLIPHEEIAQRQAELKRHPPKIPPSADAVAGDLPQHGGPALDRRLPRARGAAPQDRRDLRQPAAQPLRHAATFVLALALLAGPALAEDVAGRSGSGSARRGSPAPMRATSPPPSARSARRWRWPSSCPRTIRAGRPVPTIWASCCTRRAASARPCPTMPTRWRSATPPWGRPTRSTAQSLNNLAEALRTEGQRDEAERLHRRAIEIRRTRLAPDHPDLAESLNNLGVLLTEERRFDEAQALFDEALAIRVKALGEQHSAVAEVRSNLGALAFAQGDLREAEQRQREVLAIEEAVRGAGRPRGRVRVGQSGPGADGRGQGAGGGGAAGAGGGDSGGEPRRRSGWRPRRAATRWRWRW